MKILRNILHYDILLSVLLLMCSLQAAAQSYVELSPVTSLNGESKEKVLTLQDGAPLLYGMPFELSFDVTLTGTTDDSAPAMNQWGSAILTTGSRPFDTPANGIQVYLHAKGNNGGQLLVAANGQKFFFSNVVYNTDKFNVHFIQSNGQLTIEVTNNAITNGKPGTDVNKVQSVTKTMMFSQIDMFSYAMPTGMNISNLSLKVLTGDITNYITNIMPQGVGYLNEEAREYFVNGLSGDSAEPSALLNYYIDFVAASTKGTAVNGKRSWQLPEVGKVYTIRGVCQDNTYYWKRGEDEKFTLTPEVPNPGDFNSLFPCLWSPRVKSASDADNKMALYHATGAGQYLVRNGLTDSATSLASAQEWTISLGTEMGRVAIYGKFANGDRYMAMDRQGAKMGDWPSDGGVYSVKQNDNSWSTDYVFEEVPFLVGYELQVTGPDGLDVSDVTVRYRQKKEGTEEHYTGEGEGVVADIHNGGIVFIDRAYEESTSIWRLSVSDFTPSEIAGHVAVVTLGNGIIHVEYTQFEALKTKATAEINAAQNRLTDFADGALYSQEAINAAKEGIEASQTLFADSKPQEACAKLEETMETFYRSIEGRYVTMTNNTSHLLSTTGHTNLGVRTADASTGDYFGVYQLHYISGGAYQLRNAYQDNYVGQTTSAANVNSASNTVASRWRGTYSFNLQNTDSSHDAYNIVCTNGAANTLLGVSGTSVAKNPTDASTDATNLWDIRLVDVKTYAEAYSEGISSEAFDGTIGHAPSKAVAESLQSGITDCPDRENGKGVTVEQETTLAGILNHYIDHKGDINKPAHGQYVTIVNKKNATKYIGENYYEMKAADANDVDLSCVWETVVDGDKYYFKNLKTGMYMGKVTKSAVGRLTTKNDGALRQEIDITAYSQRQDGEGYVVLQDKGTNNYYSHLHYSSDRNAIVGWDNANEASAWTIAPVEDEALKGYLQTATESVYSTMKSDAVVYEGLGHNGFYDKTTEELNKAKNDYSWPSLDKVADAVAEYHKAQNAFNTFNNYGTHIEDNSMLLIRTKYITSQDKDGYYYITQVLDDARQGVGDTNTGSMTNAMPESTADNFYLFSLWQLVKVGEYYKLYNFYTGHYLSKDISLSNEAVGRYGLTTDPDDAASFIIRPEHGCYVSFQRSDYEETNSGFLFIKSLSGSAYRIDNGFVNGNAPAVTDGDNQARVLFSLENAKTEHLEKCLKSLLDYPIGPGLGQYTDESGQYAAEAAKLKTLFESSDKPDDYETQLMNEAKTFAPILANLKINLPEAGKYYRIYNEKDDKRWYITSYDPGKYPAMTSADAEADVHGEPATVFYYDGERLLGYGNGFYIGNGATPWVTGDVGQNFVFRFANTGYTGKGSYSIKPTGRSYLYNNTDKGLNGWGSAFNAQCEWKLEEVTELPVIVTDAGFATLYSARTHKIPAGVGCFTLETAVSGTDATLTPIETENLPAHTPVLLKAAKGTYYFKDAPEQEQEYVAEQSESKNLFKGQLETIYSTHQGDNYTEYTLQHPADREVGFYLYNGMYLQGFRIYMNSADVEELEESGALVLDFDNDETSIAVEQADTTESGDKLIYDLTGRRVLNPSNGIYIIGGKKMVISK